jgi:hypothetical protein
VTGRAQGAHKTRRNRGTNTNAHTHPSIHKEIIMNREINSNSHKSYAHARILRELVRARHSEWRWQWRD